MNSNDVTELKNFIFKIAGIISGNEGCYNSINQYDGSASSIGLLQWNGLRAKKLLKIIINKDKEQAKTILDGTNLLDDMNKDDEFWDNKILDSFECEAIRKLLITEKGVIAQIELLLVDIEVYINHGKKLGIKDKKALAFFADLENQIGSYRAEKIIQSIDPEKELTMLNILTASVLEPSLTHTISRRKCTYERIINEI
ncbi:hypothetical protein [Clostridium thailandense]|uniref:hypothetical protein n=1 Tax=Clostridium thailandense TaxID=2794346 RepID=UPI0039896FEB